MISMSITEQAVHRLTKMLELRKALPNSQNWEAEVADPFDLSKYLESYESGSLSSEESFALMSLILYALESAEKLALPDLPMWKLRIRKAIVADHPLNTNHLIYWSLPDEESDDPEHLFRITPFVREMAQQLGIDLPVR